MDELYDIMAEVTKENELEKQILEQQIADELLNG